jgi:chemotaxis protein MotB
MPKPVLIIGAVVCLILLLIVGFLDWRRVGSERDAAKVAVEAAKEQVTEFAATNAADEAEIQNLRARVAELEKAAADATKARDTLDQQMRAALDSKDVTISALQGRLTLNILDKVLFDLGSATLAPDGKAILQKVAKVLGQFPGRRIEVVGHTDNVPIHNRTAEGFTDNWSLSAGRALAAVRFLIESGVAPVRCIAAGAGEFQPVADNGAPEGRSKNRRIEVIILPDLETNGAAPPRMPSTNAPVSNP